MQQGLNGLESEIMLLQKSGANVITYWGNMLTFLEAITLKITGTNGRVYNEISQYVVKMYSYIYSCPNGGCDNADAVNVLTGYLNELKSFNC